MTVFKAFLKVLNQCKGTIILYSVILIGFGGLNMQTSDSSTNFVASKPDVLVINRDEEKGVTKELISYLKKNTEFIKVADNEEARNDALFYRDVNYIVYIPKDYRANVLAGKNPEIEIKSTGDYQSYYAQLLLERYMKTTQNYVDICRAKDGSVDEKALLEHVKSTLKKETLVETTSKLDTNKLGRLTFYFNFMNYGLLAGAIFTICMILASFNKEIIRRRILVSSMKRSTHNRSLLLSNALFAVLLWAVYTVIGFVLCGTEFFATKQGIAYMANSFVFTFCAVTIAFMLANVIQNKEALNGIINVIALGSSFLCGAFVPVEWLPDGVLAAAHILPSYWYIQNNETVKTIETWNLKTVKPLLVNMGVILAFSVVFIILANVLSGRKRENT